MANIVISLADCRPVIRVVGPTGVGKTAIAWEVVQQLQEHSFTKGVDVISADSRQVYQGLSALTGADLPEGVQFFSSQTSSHFLLPPDFGSVRVFGQAFLPINQTWSLGQQLQLVEETMVAAWESGRLPVIVGGTGLYQTPDLVSGAPARVPPNERLRAELAEFDLEMLQQHLQKLALEKWQAMTFDDQQNPRRLIRAIEVAKANQDSSNSLPTPSFLPPTQALAVGLTAEITELEPKILKRVQSRWSASLKEVTRILAEQEAGTQVAASLFTSTGFAELAAFSRGEVTRPDAETKWALRERQYAKRQLTWWRKYGQDVKWWSAAQVQSTQITEYLVETFV